MKHTDPERIERKGLPLRSELKYLPLAGLLIGAVIERIARKRKRALPR